MLRGIDAPLPHAKKGQQTVFYKKKKKKKIGKLPPAFPLLLLSLTSPRTRSSYPMYKPRYDFNVSFLPIFLNWKKKKHVYKRQHDITDAND